MSLRFTRSKDGDRRATVITKNRIGRVDLIAILMGCAEDYLVGGGEPTRKDVEDRLRHMIKWSGLANWYDESSSDLETWRKWAESEVSRLFPDLE